MYLDVYSLLQLHTIHGELQALYCMYGPFIVD